MALKIKTITIVFCLVFVFLAGQVYLNTGQKEEKSESFSEQINLCKPVIITRPDSAPFLVENVTDFTEKKITLKFISKKSNKTTDEDRWHKENKLTPKEPAIALSDSRIPRKTRFGNLAWARRYGAYIILIYETRQIIDRDKYLAHYQPVLLVCDTLLSEIKYAYDLDELFPGEHSAHQYEMVGNLIYFNSATNTYAISSNYKTAYLICFDVEKGQVIWVTTPLISNADFTVYKDVVFCGYGFTDEDDLLFVVNRYTGKIIHKIKLDSAPEKMIAKGNRLYVRTYNRDYVFAIKEE